MQTTNTNGNILIKGIDLTNEQRTMLKFRGAKSDKWVRCHSFWFKDGKPSTDSEYYYPVCKSLSFLPY